MIAKTRMKTTSMEAEFLGGRAQTLVVVNVPQEMPTSTQDWEPFPWFLEDRETVSSAQFCSTSLNLASIYCVHMLLDNVLSLEHETGNN